MSIPVAVYYDSNWYSTSNPKLMGANAASESFLKNLVQHPAVSHVGGLVRTTAEFAALKKCAEGWNPQANVQAISPASFPDLKNYEVLYRSDPIISKLAWQRRGVDASGWSLCGVTHTTCSAGALSGIRDLLWSPLEPWDAVVCTSQSVLKTVQGVLEDCGAYLQERGQGGTFQPKLELPVIPLGVEYEVLAAAGTKASNRRTQRAALGIPDDALVFLFFGRLVYHGKAHPLPMFLALQRAVEATQKNVHLIMAGWFGNEEIEKTFRASVAICSNVKVHFVDGRRVDIRQQIWSAADVFISLVDSIQETFGLTPLEAMAAGLPVIVSDWDGYRETVRHGQDGMLIPTYAPAQGAADWISLYDLEGITYDVYCASICQCTAVDVDATTAACVRLIENPELRAQMGQNGQQRVREHFAWPRIIDRYLELWEELGQRRRAAKPQAVPSPATPWLQDPFVAFGHYPTASLSAEMTLQLTSDGRRVATNPKLLQQLFRHQLLHFVKVPGLLLEPAALQVLLDRLVAGPQLAGSLLPASAGKECEQVWRTIGWLLKTDIVAVVDKPAVRADEHFQVGL